MESIPGSLRDSRAERRYESLMELASGGMATVYVGFLRGSLGFRQIVAIKRPHRDLLHDPAFKNSFIAEATVACRIHHANVVDVRDVDVTPDSIDLVMDYVEGASLARLADLALRDLQPLPPSVAIRIALDACAGLHAAHEVTDELGRALGLVHRDVSPQNILVGMDGVSRVTDFGIAKCVMRGGATTQEGVFKGKLSYMAPEYLLSRKIDRRADVFAMGVVLWESLMGQRLFHGENEPDTIMKVLKAQAPALSALPTHIAASLDPVVARALVKEPQERYASMVDFAGALEDAAHACQLRPNHREVAAFVGAIVGPEIETRRARIRERMASPACLAADAAPESVAPVSAGPLSFVQPPTPRPIESGAFTGMQVSARSAAHTAPAPRSWWFVPAAILTVGIGVAAGVLIMNSLSQPTIAAPTAAPLVASVQAVPSQSTSAALTVLPPDPSPSATAATPKPAVVRTQPKARPQPTDKSPAPTIKGPPPNPYAK